MSFPFNDIELNEVHKTTRAWHRFEDTAALAAHEASDMSLAHISVLDEARYFALARMLEAAARRSGEARDWEAARGAYQQAFAAGAVAGAGEAATRLADLHAAGDGTPASDLDAAAWYRRGAEARDPMAQLRLGLLYVEGRGVPQDLVRAHAWLNVAAATLPASQAQLRETAIVSRDAVERRLSRAERAEARRLAHELFG